MEPILLTQEALEKLKKELQELKEKRKEITQRIESALAHGDLSENFEYHEAKDAQAFNEARIKEIENIIKHAKIVSKDNNTNKVSLGSRIKVQYNDDKILELEIVSFNQTDPSKGKISNESPLGQSLLGRRVGEEFIFEAPNGAKIKYKILEIE